jgi:hypothetical protein
MQPGMGRSIEEKSGYYAYPGAGYGIFAQRARFHGAYFQKKGFFPFKLCANNLFFTRTRIKPPNR